MSGGGRRRRAPLPRLRAPLPRRHAPLPRPVRWAFYVSALVAFVGVVSLRGGASWVDARSLTLPTTALAQGHFHRAAELNALPQPLGYPLLVSPIVAGLPAVRAGTWCTDDQSVPNFKIVREVWPACSDNYYQVPVRPPWYRSQGALGVLAWIVLAAGVVQLLRALGMGRGLAEAGVVLGLAALPAASDGVVQAFHPQDFFSVGLSAAALASVLRRRWVAAGVLFGVAFACKQFALLALLPALAAAPGWRERARLGLPAAATVGVMTLPFFVLAPWATVHSLIAVARFAGGWTTNTVVGMSHVSELTKLLVARDGPIALALVLVVVARWRVGERLLEPVPLLGLTAACLGGRLVFEVLNTSYYLLAVSVMLVALDVAARRVPYRSVAWIVLMRLWINPLAGHEPSWTDSVLYLGGALVAVALGLEALTRRSARAPVPTVAVPALSAVSAGSTA